MLIIPSDKQFVFPPPEVLMKALERAFGPGTTVTLHYWEGTDETYDLYVTPLSESSFTVATLRGGRSLKLDGLNDQNALAAPVLRDAMGEAGRVIALDDGGAFYVDLVPGMSPEDVEKGWRDTGVWEDFDEFR